MATLNLTTTEDTEAQSNTTKGKRAGDPGIITNTSPVSPGSHGAGDQWCMAARFTGVTLANAETINSALFSLRANSTYNAGANTITYIVCCQAADNAGALATSGSTDLDPGTRAGTTADSGTWTQTSVTGGTRYSVDITSAVQEVVNRAGWASGNAIVVLVDTQTTCTNGEWQDYDSDSATLGPRLDIDYGGGGGRTVLNTRSNPLGVNVGMGWRMPA